MASWGPKLYQDDISEDVRDYYKDQLKRGKTNNEITKKLIEDNEELIEDEDDSPIFWFALADTQWNLGRLLPFVKDKALEYLKSGTNLTRWENEAINKKEFKTREKVLKELEEKLLAPMPQEKKISQYKLYNCEWKIGDIFAYKLESIYAKEKGLNNKYLILRKVSEAVWWPGHVIPIMCIQITRDERIPSSRDEMIKLEYIKTNVFMGTSEYLIRMISTSKKVVPNSKLIYIGNYPDLDIPVVEIPIKKGVEPNTCRWSDFENYMLEKYVVYNCENNI